jgi:hypothetical protein
MYVLDAERRHRFRCELRVVGASRRRRTGLPGSLVPLAPTRQRKGGRGNAAVALRLEPAPPLATQASGTDRRGRRLLRRDVRAGRAEARVVCSPQGVRCGSRPTPLSVNLGSGRGTAIKHLVGRGGRVRAQPCRRPVCFPAHAAQPRARNRSHEGFLKGGAQTWTMTSPRGRFGSTLVISPPSRLGLR